MQRLEGYSRSVQECKDLDAARTFAQFVFWSGLGKLLASFPQEFPLLVDGAALQRKAMDLLSQVNERTRNGKPEIRLSELEAINTRLSAIEAKLGIENSVLRVVSE